MPTFVILVDLSVKSLLFAYIVYASYLHFDGTQSEPLGMKIIRISSAFAFIANSIVLWRVDETKSVYLGISASLIAISLFSWTIIHTKNRGFKVAYSGISESKFTSDGPFKFIRHPFYSAYIFFWIGWIFSTNFNFISIVICLVLISQYILAANTEEKFISAACPDYKEYIQSTGKFLPRI